jgi:hypothetical protein
MLTQDEWMLKSEQDTKHILSDYGRPNDNKGIEIAETSTLAISKYVQPTLPTILKEKENYLLIAFSTSLSRRD